MTQEAPTPKPDPFAVRMLKFNGWTVNLVERTARRDEEMRVIEPIAARLLAYLAAHPGELISRERLRAAVWEGMSVSDDAILRSVSLIRRTFDDDPKAPAIVETVYRKGYRFVGELEALPENGARATPRARSRVWIAGAGAAILVAASAAAALILAPRSGPEPLDAARTQESFESAEAIERGDYFYYQHDSDKNELAIELYRKAIRAEPDSPLAHAKLAKALASRYSLRRDPAVRAEAAQAAQAAIWLAPDEAGGHEALGFLHLIDRDLEAAAERFNYAVERDPASDAAFHLGSVYLQLGNYPEAERWLISAQKSGPFRERAIGALGEVKYRAGRFGEAKAWFERAIETLPLNEFASVRLGQIAAIEGAEDGLRHCLELRSRLTAETFCEVVILDYRIAKRDFAGAIAEIEESRSRDSYYRLHADLRRLHIDVARGGLTDATASALVAAVERIAVLPGARPAWLKAIAFSLLGREDEAFEALAQTKAGGWVNFQWDRIEPAFAPLRDDPRFAAYLGTDAARE